MRAISIAKTDRERSTPWSIQHWLLAWTSPNWTGLIFEACFLVSYRAQSRSTAASPASERSGVQDPKHPDGSRASLPRESLPCVHSEEGLSWSEFLRPHGALEFQRRLVNRQTNEWKCPSAVPFRTTASRPDWVYEKYYFWGLWFFEWLCSHRPNRNVPWTPHSPSLPDLQRFRYRKVPSQPACSYTRPTHSVAKATIGPQNVSHRDDRAFVQTFFGTLYRTTAQSEHVQLPNESQAHIALIREASHFPYIRFGKGSAKRFFLDTKTGVRVIMLHKAAFLDQRDCLVPRIFKIAECFLMNAGAFGYHNCVDHFERKIIARSSFGWCGQFLTVLFLTPFFWNLCKNDHLSRNFDTMRVTWQRDSETQHGHLWFGRHYEITVEPTDLVQVDAIPQHGLH